LTLHGPIKVNSTNVGYWSARRVVTGIDGVNEYECTLIWHAEDMIPVSKEYKVTHHYAEGPAVLAAKVIAAGCGLVVTTTEERKSDE